MKLGRNCLSESNAIPRTTTSSDFHPRPGVAYNAFGTQALDGPAAVGQRALVLSISLAFM